MFTEWWYQIPLTLITNSGPQFKNVNGAVKNWNVTQAQSAMRLLYNVSDYGVPSLYFVRTALTSYGGVIFGDGNTPPTLRDYKLSGNLVTGYNASITIHTPTKNNDGTWSVKCEYHINNGSATNTLTIREIGLIAAAGANSGAAENKCLLERTVLDEPLIIPSLKSGLLTYTLRVCLPYETERFDLP